MGAYIRENSRCDSSRVRWQRKLGRCIPRTCRPDCINRGFIENALIAKLEWKDRVADKNKERSCFSDDRFRGRSNWYSLLFSFRKAPVLIVYANQIVFARLRSLIQNAACEQIFADVSLDVTLRNETTNSRAAVWIVARNRGGSDTH